MKDRRFVDDLSIEELERILLIKRREARLARLRQMDRSDQMVGRDLLAPAPPPPGPPPMPTDHRQFPEEGASATYHSVEIEDYNRLSLKSRLGHWLSAPLEINWRFITNKILLFVEMAAVVGLVLVVLNTWRDREKINQEAEAFFAYPTSQDSSGGSLADADQDLGAGSGPARGVLPKSTAETSSTVPNAVLLPGGHTPPDAQGFSQPEPIPEELQALAQMVTPQPVPTQGPEHAMRIVIPSIGVDHPVVEGDNWDALKRGVGHTPWSANPGEAGNSVLSAHNDVFGEIFRRLPELELGDEILVHTGRQIYRYIVNATRVVEPTQVDVMEPTDHPVLTLISSYPYLVDDRRIVVIADLDPSYTE
jgi:sortase A